LWLWFVQRCDDEIKTVINGETRDTNYFYIYQSIYISVYLSILFV